MTKFENNSNTREIAEAAFCQLRINDRHTVGQRGFWFMMIQHHHVYSAFLKLRNLNYRRRAAINGDEQSRLMLFETTLDTFPAQAVALLPAQRQKQFRR